MNWLDEGALYSSIGLFLREDLGRKRLALIGLGDRYSQETKALGFNGIYERYLASQASFPDDPKAYRAAVEAKRARQGVGRETAVIEE